MADDILKNIPLPADLPENWTSQQTVAPTGAEVGMDEQHGYNYLMKQVNNAQKAAKALNAGKADSVDPHDLFIPITGWQTDTEVAEYRITLILQQTLRPRLWYLSASTLQAQT